MIQDPNYVRKNERKGDVLGESLDESQGRPIARPELDSLSHVADSLHIPAAAEQIDSHPNPTPHSSLCDFVITRKMEEEEEEVGKDINEVKDMVDPVMNVSNRVERETDQAVGQKEETNFVFPDRVTVYQPGDFAWMLLRQRVGPESPNDVQEKEDQCDSVDEEEKNEEKEEIGASGCKNFLWPCVIVASRVLSEQAMKSISDINDMRQIQYEKDALNEENEIRRKKIKIECKDSEEIKTESKEMDSAIFGISKLAYQVHQRLDLFQMDRWEYLIRLLPLPSSLKVESTGVWPEPFTSLQTTLSNCNVDFFNPGSLLPDYLVIPDFFLVPFKYTTEPTLPSIENPRLTRALIQAVYIQSSWSEEQLCINRESETTESREVESSRNTEPNENLEEEKNMKLDQEVQNAPDKDFEISNLIAGEMNRIIGSEEYAEAKNDFSIFEKEVVVKKESVQEIDLQNQTMDDSNRINLVKADPGSIYKGNAAKLDSGIFHPISIPDPILPDWRKPIQMTCPSIRGLYYNAKIYQNMIEPKLANRINSGVGVVDLTDQLNQQGVSHWKNTKGKISFFLAKTVPKIPPCPPFPSEEEIERVRLGPLLIQKGDYLVVGGISNGRDIVHVQEIATVKGVLSFAGASMNGQGRVTFQASMVKGRFTGCFDEPIREWKTYELCDWEGRKLVSRERMLNTK